MASAETVDTPVEKDDDKDVEEEAELTSPAGTADGEKSKKKKKKKKTPAAAAVPVVDTATPAADTPTLTGQDTALKTPQYAPIGSTPPFIEAAGGRLVRFAPCFESGLYVVSLSSLSTKFSPDVTDNAYLVAPGSQPASATPTPAAVLPETESDEEDGEGADDGLDQPGGGDAAAKKKRKKKKKKSKAAAGGTWACFITINNCFQTS